MAMQLLPSYSAQHCLLVMVEKWKQCLDNGGVSLALLTDLFKAFCILHDLLIENLQLMVSTTIPCKCCKATSQAKNKEQKLMMRIVNIMKFCSEFYKALY